MRKILLMTVWAMWVTNGVLLAQDAKASTDQKLESVKKLRTQVLSKLPALADLFDPDHNGMAPALGSCLLPTQLSMMFLLLSMLSTITVMRTLVILFSTMLPNTGR